MSAWIVYSKDGSIERCKLRRLEYGGTAMGERAVTATFDYHSEVAFEVFDYIEYRGERFELEAVPTVKKLSSFEYQYELRFVSLKHELERCEMRDLVPSDNGVVYPTPLTFSFTGDVRYLTDRIQACLDAMYGTGVWKIIIADETSSEEKNITIAQQNCWNALALVNSTYGLNFYIKGRTITIGGEQPLVSHTFEYGKGNGLYEIERASDTETGIVTKLRAYGSTRNLDYSYPKKPEWSDSVLPVSFALSPLRLMLPSFKTDGKTDYVLADDAAISKYGIREASMVYDDIYPSIAGATYNGQAIDEIKAVDAVDESQKTFVVYLHELGFDLEEHLTTSAQISMKSGALQGYTFTISSIEKQTGGYKITLGKNSLENSEESGVYVPGVNWNMKAGDKFVLLNILMPQKYIRDAENRLLARANEYLSQYSKTNFSYNIGLHDKFLIQNPSVYNSLIEGSKLKVYDKEIGIDEEVAIQSITITENLEDNILPQVKVTLNNEPSASTLDRIQGKLNEVAAETAANGFTTQSEIMAQYRRKLDKPFFDKLFVAIDANGNEIPSTDVITPIAYIKAKYHVASVGGFTMYAMDKDVDIPSLASGLPFDGRTIWYNPDTKQIEVIGGTGGGSGEGVSNFWDLSGIPSWITNSKPKYTYSEIEGTPDLTKYALVSQIPSLSGYATESWVLQKNYATKATTLSGYGITDAYTKANVNNLLKGYVTIAGTEDVTGIHNFTNGIKVGGIVLKKFDDGVVYIDGNLVVKGGVTMYGSDSSFTPSTIMDAILYDDATLGINSNGQLYVKGGTSGGGLDITALQNYLTQNSYLNVTGGDNRYLKLSGGTINGTNPYPLVINTTETQSGIQFLSNNDLLGVIVNGGEYGTALINFKGKYRVLGIDNDGNAYTTIDYNNTKGILLHSANYSSYALPLSGGTLTGNYYSLTLKSSNQYASVIKFENTNGVLGYMGLDAGGNPALYDENLSNGKSLWHAGNDGSGSGLDADLLDGRQPSELKVGSADVLAKSFSENINYGTYHSALKLIYNTQNDNYGFPNLYVSGLSVMAGYTGWQLMSHGGPTENPYFRSLQDTGAWKPWRQIAFLTDNVASATKLQTARTIWGQSFDGTGNVSGRLDMDSLVYFMQGGTAHGYLGFASSDTDLYLSANRTLFISGKNNLILNGYSDHGNVGIGTTNPQQKLHVLSSGYQVMCLESNGYTESSIAYKNKNGNMWVAGILDNDFFIWSQTASNSRFRLNTSGDGLFYGGVTMYSDIRKKTKIKDVELSLQQVANAPLIEHYYNSDKNKTTHVGSIAQYWASMNDWFCKLDSEGFYTMEIQNAALASAISIARELDRYETKTDKAIKKLKKRICELEEEVERLKSA